MFSAGVSALNQAKFSRGKLIVRTSMFLAVNPASTSALITAVIYDSSASSAILRIPSRVIISW
jgi:hypothetical protein